MNMPQFKHPAQLKNAPEVPSPYRDLIKSSNRANSACKRIYEAIQIWPWEIVPQYEPNHWSVNILEDLSAIAVRVSKGFCTLQEVKADLTRRVEERADAESVRKLNYELVIASRRHFSRRDGALPDSDPETPLRPDSAGRNGTNALNVATPQSERARLTKTTSQSNTAGTHPTNTTPQSQSDRNRPPKRSHRLSLDEEADTSPNPSKRTRTRQQLREAGMSPITPQGPGAGAHNRPSTHMNSTTQAELEVVAEITVDTGDSPAATPRPSRGLVGDPIPVRRLQSADAEDDTPEDEQAEIAAEARAIAQDLAAQTSQAQRKNTGNAAGEKNNAETPFDKITQVYTTGLKLNIAAVERELSEARQKVEARGKAIETTQKAQRVYERRANTAMDNRETAEADVQRARDTKAKYQSAHDGLRSLLGGEEVPAWVAVALQGSQQTLDESEAALETAQSALHTQVKAHEDALVRMLEAQRTLDQLRDEQGDKNKELIDLEKKAELEIVTQRVLIVLAQDSGKGLRWLEKEVPGILSRLQAADQAGDIENDA